MTFLTSCLTSLRNLVTYTTVATDDRITGNWQHDDLAVKIESVPTSSFLKENGTGSDIGGKKAETAYGTIEDSLLYSRSYLIEFSTNNYRYYMLCCLTHIGHDLYADLQPSDAEPLDTASDVSDMFGGGSYTTTHSIAKIFPRGNVLELRILNGDFIKEQLNNGAAAIRYEKDDLFATTLITASSQELRQFLSKYGKDERLYSSKYTITLKRI
jgi:hypothetical protein